jgi:hypothetical protein
MVGRKELAADDADKRGSENEKWQIKAGFFVATVESKTKTTSTNQFYF